MSLEESQVNEENSTSTPTPGEMLRNAREKAGISQQQMADKLFLKVKNIVDIENDHIDENMSATFAKGYVRMYAKQLGVDEGKVIAEFNRIHTVTKPPAKLQSFSKRVAKQAHDDRWMMVTWVILFLLLAALVAWWYQQSDGLSLLSSEPASSEAQKTVTNRAVEQSEPQRREQAMDSQDAEQAAMPDAQVEPQTSPLPAGDDQETSVEPAEDDGTADQTEIPGESSGSVSIDNDADVASNDDTLPQAETPDAPAGDAIELVFTFAEDCWINIEDATGEAIAYGVKAAGRVMPVSGQAPFKVTLGAPDGVSITYDGEAIDISAFQNGQIARFSLPMQD